MTYCLRFKNINKRISTHILTKRMTADDWIRQRSEAFQLTSSRRGWHGIFATVSDIIFISTHILTKRMTIIAWSFFVAVQYFNSHPHEEDDRSRVLLSMFHSISTHILTKRMTFRRHNQDTYSNIFQLTSSRRGWLCLTPYLCQYGGHFNSHPHEEDDLRLSDCCLICGISTHILTKRMTIVPVYIVIPVESFQLTSSRRGWRKQLWRDLRTIHFNSHPHEEDDPRSNTVELSNATFQLTSSRRGWPTWGKRTRRKKHFNSHPHEEDDKN